MRDDDARLAALGIHVVSPHEQPAVREACIRVARRLRHAGCRVVGLLPASDEIGVPGVAVQLGLALAEVTGGTVAFVDANLRWPAIPHLARDEPRADGGGEGSEVDSAFVTSWLRGSLALLTPRQVGPAGAGVPQLAQVIKTGAELFAHVLVDLTGFRQLGEHLAAIEMVNGVLVVARARLTREEELLELDHELPPSHNLGVLLVG